MQTPLFKDHHGTKNKVYAYTVVVLVSLLRALWWSWVSINTPSTPTKPDQTLPTSVPVSDLFYY